MSEEPALLQKLMADLDAATTGAVRFFAGHLTAVVRRQARRYRYRRRGLPAAAHGPSGRR